MLLIKPGTITAIIGPNGAGKSTLLNQLWRTHQHLHISSIAQHDTALGDTLVRTRIEHGGEAIEAIAEELQISHLLNRRLKTLSGGERKRVHIARCLVDEKAQVYLLDEPDAGLDTQGKQQLASALKRRAQAGKSIFLALHDLEWKKQLSCAEIQLTAI
jgi:ABC-type Mn2+/Zn2+ transport system ATPase subunit